MYSPQYAGISMLNRTRSAPICNWVQTKQMWTALSTRSSAFTYYARVSMPMHVQLWKTVHTVHTAWPKLTWNSRQYGLDSSELEQITCSTLSSLSPVAKILTKTHLWVIALLMSQPSANCVASPDLYHVHKLQPSNKTMFCTKYWSLQYSFI